MKQIKFKDTYHKGEWEYKETQYEPNIPIEYNLTPNLIRLKITVGLEGPRLNEVRYAGVMHLFFLIRPLYLIGTWFSESQRTNNIKTSV